jgi:hypothetical protein
MEFDLLPHVGAGPLRFGTPRAQVRSILSGLGFPLESELDTVDHFCEGAIGTEYTTH